MVLKEFHRMSLLYRWALLATSWWEELMAMHATRLVFQASLADTDLMLQTCQPCWTFHLLSTLQRLDIEESEASGQDRLKSPGTALPH